MTSSGARPTLEINRGLLRGGVVLLGAGVMLALAGTTASAIAVLGGVRRWVNQLEESPTDVARRRLAQTRRAVSAGSDAWRREGSEARPERSRDMASVGPR
jgi:hypothetical protein